VVQNANVQQKTDVMTRYILEELPKEAITKRWEKTRHMDTDQRANTTLLKLGIDPCRLGATTHTSLHQCAPTQARGVILTDALPCWLQLTRRWSISGVRPLPSLPLHPEETGYEDIKESRFLLRVSLSSGTASAHSIRLGMGNQVASKGRGDDVVFIGFAWRDIYLMYIDTIDDR
jgi:hypothetical protein